MTRPAGKVKACSWKSGGNPEDNLEKIKPQLMQDSGDFRVFFLKPAGLSLCFHSNKLHKNRQKLTFHAWPP
jgi:hypothetical protein